MYKKISKLTLVMCLSACIAFAGEEASVPTSTAIDTNTVVATTDTTTADISFPLVVKGKEFIINKAVEQKDLDARLTELLGEKTEMEATNRLQYDFVIEENMAPMALVIDYDQSGKIAQIIIDAMSEEENLPAQELLKWLNEKAGAGKQVTDEDIVTTEWQFNTWNFTFSNGSDGEESVYSFTITPLD